MWIKKYVEKDIYASEEKPVYMSEEKHVRHMRENTDV